MLLAAEVSARKELEEAGIDGESVADWLPECDPPVAFLSMLERLRLPASLECFLPGLVVEASYE
jgi:hypothetical protein